MWHQKFQLCGQGESNSRLILGKDPLYHLTMAANISMTQIILQLTTSAQFFVIAKIDVRLLRRARQDSNPERLIRSQLWYPFHHGRNLCVAYNTWLSAKTQFFTHPFTHRYGDVGYYLIRRLLLRRSQMFLNLFELWGFIYLPTPTLFFCFKHLDS